MPLASGLGEMLLLSLRTVLKVWFLLFTESKARGSTLAECWSTVVQLKGYETGLTFEV